MRSPVTKSKSAPTRVPAAFVAQSRFLVWLMAVLRVASASVRDGISAAAVVFAPDYGSEDDQQIRPHLFSRDCAGSTSPDSLAPAA